jgi:hypothetical protein
MEVSTHESGSKHILNGFLFLLYIWNLHDNLNTTFKGDWLMKYVSPITCINGLLNFEHTKRFFRKELFIVVPWL